MTIIESKMIVANLLIVFLTASYGYNYDPDDVQRKMVDANEPFDFMPAHNRGRNLLQFKNMVKPLTERRALDFNNYGNYCGFGGSGKPVDAIDRCCQVHDNCYDTQQKTNCNKIWGSGYFASYTYVINGKTITCTNDPVNHSCMRGVCECDAAAATCFYQNLNSYNPKNKQ